MRTASEHRRLAIPSVADSVLQAGSVTSLSRNQLDVRLWDAQMLLAHRTYIVAVAVR